MANFSIDSRSINGLITDYNTSRNNLARSLKKLVSGDRLCNVGDEPSNLARSERIRSTIRCNTIASQNIELTRSYLNTTDAYLQNTFDSLGRMQGVIAIASDATLTAGDRQSLDAELQMLKQEITSLTRQGNYQGKQTIGRESIASYDSLANQMTFWTPIHTKQPVYTTKSFAADQTDSHNQLLNFDPTAERTMSRDGSALYYFDTTANHALCRYDIANDRVSVSSDTYSSGSALITDEKGQIYVNDNGSLYNVDPTGLTRTVTPLTSLNAGQRFAVYKDQAYYRDATTSNFVTSNLTVSPVTTTTLVDATNATNNTNLNLLFATQHAIAPSGKYIAGQINATTIGFMDTTSGQYSTFSAAASSNITALQISEEGDRIYYIDSVGHTVNTVEISYNGALTDGGVFIETPNTNCLNGLSVGGSSFSSCMECYVGQSTSNILSYSAADVRTYALGLANTRVDTFESAQIAFQDIKEATNRLSANQVIVGCNLNTFNRALDASEASNVHLQASYDQIRDIDIAKSTAEMSQHEMQMNISTALISKHKTMLEQLLILLR